MLAGNQSVFDSSDLERSRLTSFSLRERNERCRLKQEVMAVENLEDVLLESLSDSDACVLLESLAGPEPDEDSILLESLSNP